MKLIPKLLILFFCAGLQAQVPQPKLWYTFEDGQALDQSGNGYNGTLHGSAQIKNFGSKSVLSLGSDKGYLDMGQAVGQLTGKLTDFTISAYVYVPQNGNSLGANGNFIASFSNSPSIENSATGYAILSARVSGYAITPNDYRNEQFVKKNTTLPTGAWKHVTYVQSGKTGKLYINATDSVINKSVTITPKNLGATQYNWIGRSCYTGDTYFNNAYIDEFRIYDQALTPAQVKQLTAEMESYQGQKEPYFEWTAHGNPIITHKYTADVATMVYNDTLWIFSGEDFTGGQSGYHMENWCVFSTTDMKHYTEYPTPLRGADFKWSSGQAYAAQTVERNGKFYFYVSTNTTGIGVAVADRPEGPYKDALGRPLLTNADCFATSHSWTCIDPAIFIDDDGQAWIFWGNGACYYAKLKENMIQIDGPIKKVDFEGLEFTEAPWVHKYKGKYYLTYASGFPEKISYAMADGIEGPWEYKGILNEIAGNSNTNHQAIVQYRDNWYFVYHNGAMQTQGGSYSRSVCVDELKYNDDGTLQRIIMTTEGVKQLPPLDTALPRITASPSPAVPFYYNTEKESLELGDTPVDYKIFDLAGNLLKEGRNTRINTTSLIQGTYILSVGRKSWKFIK